MSAEMDLAAGTQALPLAKRLQGTVAHGAASDDFQFTPDVITA